MAAGLATIMLTPGPARAATAVFVQESNWYTGYVGRMTVTNDGTGPISAWRVEFDLPAGTTVDQSWNATVTRTGTHYLITGAAWNASLAPGASTNFGWIATGQGVPQGCLLNGAPCAGTPAARDFKPPSTPANLRGAGPGNTFTLQWDASTDDTGVVGYEIYTNTSTGPIATVTTTNHSLPTPPPVVMTFAVRAIDAGGNRSPFATLGLGTPPDVTPPSPPTNLRLPYGSDGYFMPQWDASQDDQFVAGYAVTVDGAVVSMVSDTTAFVRFGSYGTYRVGVRAFDGAGNSSTLTETRISIEPSGGTGPTSGPPTTSRAPAG